MKLFFCTRFNIHTKMTEYKFEGNKNTLKFITIPNGYTSLAKDCFSECKQLYSVKLPNSIKIIGENAFGNCINLESINIPPFLERIETNAFHDCCKLRRLILKDTLNYIGSHAFYNCTNLNLLVLVMHSYNYVIQNGAFENISESCTILMHKEYYHPSMSTFGEETNDVHFRTHTKQSLVFVSDFTLPDLYIKTTNTDLFTEFEYHYEEQINLLSEQLNKYEEQIKNYESQISKLNNQKTKNVKSRFLKVSEDSFEDSFEEISDD